MTISIMIFAPVVAIATIGLLFLAVRMHKEAMNFVTELQFFLKHRTIAHNQVKARLAVFKTRFEKIEKENIELKRRLEGQSDEAGFDGLLAETVFVESQNFQIEKLETEISSIQETLKGDFKAQLSSYMKEVDGLSQRLGKAKEEFIAGRTKNSLESLKRIA